MSVTHGELLETRGRCRDLRHLTTAVSSRTCEVVGTFVGFNSVAKNRQWSGATSAPEQSLNKLRYTDSRHINRFVPDLGHAITSSSFASGCRQMDPQPHFCSKAFGEFDLRQCFPSSTFLIALFLPFHSPYSDICPRLA